MDKDHFTFQHLQRKKITSQLRRAVGTFSVLVTAYWAVFDPLNVAAQSSKPFSFPNISSVYGGVKAGYGVNPNAADPSEIILGLGIRFTYSTNGPINGGGFTYNVDLIHDSSNVFQSQSASLEAEGRYLMFSAKASFAISVASHKTTDSVMWTVTADKDYGVREQATFVDLTDVARARWQNDGYDAFVRQFGDRFISSWARRAHLAIIFEAYSLTQEDQQHVDAMIEASGQYAAGSFDAKAKMSSEFHSLSSSARTRVNFTADGIAVDNYFVGATDLTALDQIQVGIIRLLSDIEKQQGNVTQYFTTPYADVVPGFPLVRPYPEFPELEKAQRAFEQAYTIKLQIEAFRNGPRGPYLESRELEYLTGKTTECDARLAKIVSWLKQFKQDSTLKARSWPDLQVKLPDLIWYTAQPFPAVGPRGQIPIMSVFVGGGAEVGSVFWSDGAGQRQDLYAGDALWPSLQDNQSLGNGGSPSQPDQEKLNQVRGENGSMRRWFEIIEISGYGWDNPNWARFRGSFYAELKDRNGNVIKYAKDRFGRYVVPSLAIGNGLEPWPGMGSDLFYKTLEAGDYGNFIRISKPIDGAEFENGQPIAIEANWFRGSGNAQVRFLLDGADLSGGLVTASDSDPNGVIYHYTLRNAAPGIHTLDIAPSGNDQFGFKLAPISFTVNPLVVAPSISVQPASANPAPGSTVVLSATITGSEPLTYTWQYHGQELFDNTRISGSGSPVLTINSVSNFDSGSYTLLVQNAAGSTSTVPAQITVANQWRIGVSSMPSVGGTQSGGGTYADGSSVTVIAMPTAGYAFTNWTEGNIVVSSSTAYTFTAQADRVLIANFVPTLPTTREISVSPSPGVGGTVVGGGTFTIGDSVTVSAVPAAGYVFSNWTESGTTVSSSASYTFTVKTDRILVANFATGPTNGPRVQIGRVTASPGAAAVIPITLENGTGKENAVSFSIMFSTSQTSFGKVALGSATTGASLVVNDSQAATGLVGVVLSLPVNQKIPIGATQLATLTLNLATGLTTGTVIPITFTNSPAFESLSDALGNDEQVVWIDGNVTVGASGFEGDVAPRPGGNNLDSAADVTVMGRIVAGLESNLSGAEFQRADCAPRSTLGNGTISVGDLTQVARYVAGLDAQTPTGGPTGPALTGLALRKERIRTQGTAMRLALSTTSAAPGTALTVSLQTSAQGNENALSFSIQFDPTKVAFGSASPGAAAAAGSLVVNTNESSNGRIGFVFSLPVNQTLSAGDVELLKVNFLAGTNLGSVPIVFANQPAPESASDILGNDLQVEFMNGAIDIQDGSVPVITTQPVSLVVAPGGEAMFSVSATGAETYQWSFNGVNIPGATDPRLTVSELSVQSAGLYTVTVSNRSQSTTSAPAVLGLFGDIKMYAGVTLAAPVGTRFRIEFSDTVGAGEPWQTLMTVTLEKSSRLVVDPDSPEKPHRYYRAVISP